MPLGTPVRQHHPRRPMFTRGQKLPVHHIVLRPGPRHRTRKRQHILRIQPVIPYLFRRIPFRTLLNCLPRIIPHKCSRLRARRISPDVLKPPLKRPHHPVIVGRPTPVLISPYPMLIPAHRHTLSLTNLALLPKPSDFPTTLRGPLRSSAVLCGPLRLCGESFFSFLL